MAVNAQAQTQGQGTISLGGNFDLSQLGMGSPAAWSAGLFLVLLAVVVLVVLGLR